MSYTLTWKNLNTLNQLKKVISGSQMKPVLLFKHRSSSTKSNQVKQLLENEWTIPPNQLDCYLVDVMENKSIASKVSDFAGVSNVFPQVLLFADEVAMYDESHEMINVKKIKIALKIVNRTFRWMETRV
ncbi:MAG: monothiol bacilliredoxin BrxC family protein [Bacteroidota bacterium]